MEADKKWDLASVASIPLIMTLGNSMLIPVLPAIRTRLGITSLQVSLLITVYSAVAILLIPIAGYLSDRYGRKAVIIPSLIAAGLGGLVSGLASWWIDEPYAMILAGRVLQGIGAAGAAPIVLPLIGDLFKREKDVSQGLGIVETSNTLGKVLSPILGSFLASFLWYLPFLFIPVFCVISILMVLFLVKSPEKEPGKPVKLKSFLASVRYIFTEKGRWLYAIFAIGGICMFVIFGTLFYLSDELEAVYGIKGVLKGVVLAIPLAALCVSSFFTGRKIGQNKILMKWLTFIGTAVLTGAVFACGFLVHSVPWIIALLCISGLGMGLVLPSLDAFITEGIDKKQRGTITSLYSSMRFIGVAIGPPAVSILLNVSKHAMFYTVSGACLFAAIIAMFAIHPNKGALKSDKSKGRKKMRIRIGS
ncbi:MFS transporter [Paenibacillus swuensis]|uniref:MFS transporter n=1 Tax=Paenibacillus swuensis TaxID=1178515 RepID=A0A172TMB5_9BACL|nr:MFS transporter [Paenibacillus swuensis]ANE48122.1 MFS transporter [Paenibacillus swuensis]